MRIHITAVAGTDYVDVSGPLTFDVGESTKTFDVPILDDDVFEQDETIILNLSGFVNSIPVSSPMTATIKIVDVYHTIYLPTILKNN